jgi:virginiamycin A acetyltransferase
MPHQLPKPMKNTYKLIYKQAGYPIRGLIYYLVTKYEGGECWSTTLREIFKEVYNIQVGIGSYGCFRPTALPDGTVIGNYCSIAENVRFISYNHPTGSASTHPLFYFPPLGFVKEESISRTRTIVGHDVWIGWNSLILSNCRQIGTGAIIGAGSIVMSDIEPYSIVAGVPAKLVKQRFSDEIISRLLESQWFLLSPEQLAQIVDAVSDTDHFIMQVENLRKVKN